MNRMRLGLAAAIIAVVILIGFMVSVPHTRDLKEKEETKIVAVIPGVTVHDTFKKGTHTITGSLLVPNACTPVTASSTVSGTASTTQQIVITLTYQADAGICLQVPTRATFETSVIAPGALPITATVNGSVASTTRS